MKFIKNYASRLKRSLFLGGSLGKRGRGWKNVFNDIKGLNHPSSDCNSNSSFDDLLKKGVFTEEKLSKAKKMCLYMSHIALFLSVIILFYLLYCAIKGYYITLMVGFLVFLVTLGLAFKYHFWHMQVVKRRLGCSFGDWLAFTFKRKKSNQNEYKDEQL